MNADLALSVSMTTGRCFMVNLFPITSINSPHPSTSVSTILSCGFLPANLALYSYAAYGNEDAYDESVFQSIDFGAIFISLGVVIGAICIGIFMSWKFDTPRWHKTAYILGNTSGIAMIVFSTVILFVGDREYEHQPQSTDASYQADIHQYIAISIPCLLGMAIATIISTLMKLPKAERLTIAVECCFQNGGIATSAALSLFSGEDLQAALIVSNLLDVGGLTLIADFIG